METRPRTSAIEIARRAFDAFNRSFAEGTNDYFELLHEEVEWAPITALLDGASYSGHDEVRDWIEDWRRDWAMYEIWSDEVHDLGEGRVLIFGTWHARGRRGGVQLSFAPGAWLIDVQGEKVTRSQTFT
ncbi:MAG: nuclear transport factor 2 family protein, partial [Solirubrobacterales bacterium]